MEEKELKEYLQSLSKEQIIDLYLQKCFENENCINNEIKELKEENKAMIYELQSQLAEKEKQILEYQEQSMRDNQKFVDAFVSFQQQHNTLHLRKQHKGF